MAIQSVTTEQVREKMDQGAQVINVLSYDDDRMIEGSKKIPLSELSTRLKELDPSREVITHCSGQTCKASKTAAELLDEKGFQVSHYLGGLEEWEQSGLPISRKEKAA